MKKTKKKQANDTTLTERLELRLTPADKAKVMQLGGSEWVRKKIRAAAEPRA